MKPGPDIDPSLAMALLGLQDAAGVAGSAALMLAMERRHGSATREQAARTASRYALSSDLVALVPREPGRLSSRKRRTSFQSALLGLKRIDEMPSPDREEAIAQVAGLLGVQL